MLHKLKEYAVDRELIAKAALDKNLSEQSFRLLCTLQKGEITKEVQDWVDFVILSITKG